MSRVTRRSSAVNFQFTISETQEVSLADVRVKVQNAITRVRYNETAPFQSVGLAFASLPDLSSRENVSIHTLDYYPTANRPGVVTQAYYQVDSFFTEIGKFNITDMFIKKGTGLDVPLYWEHQIPITTDLFIQSGSDIIVLDRNFDPMDPEDYLVWEGPTYWSVFHNFKHEYDGVTGDYAAYYVSYPLWDSTRITQREHVELLDPTPRFRLAVEDDYDGLFELPDDVPLYEVQNIGDRFQVNIYYDIVANSPMNDIYVSPTPYVYAYRPQQIHEIGPLYPAALSQEDPWFPLLTNGNFFASSNEYLIAEYAQQPFIPYQPYKREIYDEAIILERTLIKTQKQNLYVDALSGFHLELLIFNRDENIKYAASTDTTKEFYVDAVGEFTNIPYDHEGFESVNSEDGLIQINYSLVELDDIILANYYYIEADFAYTQVNMNPIYVPDIAKKSVVLYMVPYASQTVTMYHLVLDEEDQVEDSNGIPDSVAIPGPTNVSHGTVLVGRGYTDPVDATWYIEITQKNSVPGVITDAKYEYRKGAFGAPIEAFMITDWVTLGSGVQIKFEPGTGGQDFEEGDTWTIEVQSNDIGLTDDIIGITYDEFLDTYCLPGPDDWDSITAYVVGDKVNHEGVFYTCILDHTNFEPPNATYWVVFTSSEFLVVARYGIGSNRGLQDLQLVDTRVRGGGIDPDQLSEAKLAYPDISWMFDIGHYDGAPFPGSASVLIDLPAGLLEINGGIFTRDQVDSIVKHHLSFGVYPVVRFYCTNTGLVSHETVPDETYVWNWTVPEGEKCPTPDGEVICQYEFLTTTTSTTTTSSTSTTSTTTTTWPCLFYESFTGINGSAPNPVRWVVSDGGNGVSKIQNNKLNQDIDSTGGATKAQVDYIYTVDGDFDVRVDYNLLELPDTDFWSIQLQVNDNNNTASSIVRGYYDDVVTGQQYRTSEFDAGFTWNGDILTTDTSGKLCITRVGTTWTSYYHDGVNWVQNHQFTQTTAVADVSISLALRHGTGNPGAEAEWDNFCIAVGDIQTTTTSTTTTTTSTTSSTTSTTSSSTTSSTSTTTSSTP